MFVVAGEKKKKKKNDEVFDICQLRGYYIQSPKKPQKVLVSVVFFLIYFAELSLVFKLKQSLEDQPYPEKKY